MPTEFSKASDNAYWAWSYKHLAFVDREQTLSRECFNAGFYLGAQYATRTTGEMSPHLARFLEFVMWLTDRSEDSASSSTKTGTSSAEIDLCNCGIPVTKQCQCDVDPKHGLPCDEQDEIGAYCTDPNGHAVMRAHHYQGHKTELRNDDSVYCLECHSTIAVADG